MYASKRPMNTRELVTVEMMECIDARNAQRERDRLLSGQSTPAWSGGFRIIPSSDQRVQLRRAMREQTNVVCSLREYRE